MAEDILLTLLVPLIVDGTGKKKVITLDAHFCRMMNDMLKKLRVIPFLDILLHPNALMSRFGI